MKEISTLIYVAGPIRAYKPDGSYDWFKIRDNLQRGRDAAWTLKCAGFAVYSPHIQPWEWTVELVTAASYDVLTEGLYWLEQCYVVLFLPGWDESNGCQGEMSAAKSAGKRIYFEVETLVREEMKRCTIQANGNGSPPEPSAIQQKANAAPTS